MPRFRYGLLPGLAHAAVDTYLLRGRALWTLRYRYGPCRVQGSGALRWPALTQCLLGGVAPQPQPSAADATHNAAQKNNLLSTMCRSQGPLANTESLLSKSPCHYHFDILRFCWAKGLMVMPICGLPPCVRRHADHEALRPAAEFAPRSYPPPDNEVCTSLATTLRLLWL